MADAVHSPEPRGLSLRAQLLRGGGVGMVLRVGSIAAGLASAVVLARVLGPESYGVYAFVFSVITLLGLLVKLGLPTLILRETARADQAADGGLMTGIWRWSDRVMILMSFVVCAGVVAYFWVFADREGSARMAALLWALPLIPLIGVLEAKGAALRGLRRIFLGGSPGKILRPVLLATSVMVVSALFPGALEATHVYMLHACVAALSLGLILVLLRWATPSYQGAGTPTVHSKAWIAAIVPLAAIAGLQLVSHNTDILMLGWLATDTDVGIYRVALSAANVALFGLSIANLVLQPYFARAWQAGDHGQLQKLATAGARVAFGASLPILALFWFGGTWLLGFVFGDAYIGAFWALAILCLGQTVSALLGTNGSLLTMAGRERIALAGLAVSTVANVLLNYLLIPIYGIEGAAIATAVSIIVWNLCLWVAAWRLMGIDTSLLGLRPVRRS